MHRVLKLAVEKEALNFQDRRIVWALGTHYADAQVMVRHQHRLGFVEGGKCCQANIVTYSPTPKGNGGIGQREYWWQGM